MALHQDLLEQAKHLAKREPKRPRQASLRRAVSAAYYALFHLLVSEGATRLAPTQPSGLRRQVQRAFVHGQMKDVCKTFGAGNAPNGIHHLITLPLQTELKSISLAFVDLQEKRHKADYDLTYVPIRLDVLQAVQSAEQAFNDWNTVKKSHNASVFLASLLLQKHWAK